MPSYFRLGVYEGMTIFPLAALTTGTYRVNLGVPGGNAIISTLYVKSLSGSVQVKYYDEGSGDGGTVYHGWHDAITGGAPVTSRCTIFRVSPKPIVEIIVTGNCELSIYAQVVPDQPIFENLGNKQAVVIHKALDGDDHENRNAIPMLGFADDAGALRYPRVNDLKEQVVQSANLEDLVELTKSPGFHVGEVYDRIVAAEIATDHKLLEYSYSDVCQFQFVVKREGKGFDIIKRPCEFFLLKEDGSFLLQENTSKLKVSGLIPV